MRHITKFDLIWPVVYVFAQNMPIFETFQKILVLSLRGDRKLFKSPEKKISKKNFRKKIWQNIFWPKDGNLQLFSENISLKSKSSWEVDKKL